MGSSVNAQKLAAHLPHARERCQCAQQHLMVGLDHTQQLTEGHTTRKDGSALLIVSIIASLTGPGPYLGVTRLIGGFKDL
eukprot:6046748-Pyramimonas_sp.AAC.2